MATMKIKKDETIRFDGTWITNGFWMSHRNRITLSDKAMQGLIDASIPFSRQGYGGEIETGDKVNTFQAERVMPEESCPGSQLVPTRFLYEIEDNGATTVCRVMKHDSGRLVAVSERYAVLWAGLMLYQHAPLKAIGIDNGTETIAVVMPVNSDMALSEQVNRLHTGSQV